MAIPIAQIDASVLPQDPFLPRFQPEGPSFLDSEACLCALRTTPGTSSDGAAWQCIGNQTEGVYVVNTGKWFNTANGGKKVNGPMWDSSNPPDTSSALQWKQGSGFQAANLDELTIWDRHCTAENRSSFSTSWYNSVNQLSRDEVPIDAAPCWRPGAIPMQIQDENSWVANGCNEGFRCPSILSFPFASHTLRLQSQFLLTVYRCE